MMFQVVDIQTEEKTTFAIMSVFRGYFVSSARFDYRKGSTLVG